MIFIKPAYSDYTRMMWRFFLSVKGKPRPGSVEEANYNACLTVWNGLTEAEREIVTLTAYARRDNELIREFAEDHHTNEQHVWAVSYRAERKLAVERGLISNRESRS